jgi:hypothetical protein
MDTERINTEELSLDVVTRKQQREETSLEVLHRSLEKVYARFKPEIESDNPDLNQRAVMAAAVLAMVRAAPTYRDAREGLKQLQTIHGHSVTKHETHNHLNLDSRLAAGIQEAQRLGLLEPELKSAVVEISNGHQTSRDGQPSPAGPASVRVEEARGVRTGTGQGGGAATVQGESGLPVLGSSQADGDRDAEGRVSA